MAIERIQIFDDKGRYCLFCNADGCYDLHRCKGRRVAEKVNEIIDRLERVDARTFYGMKDADGNPVECAQCIEPTPSVDYDEDGDPACEAHRS